MSKDSDTVEVEVELRGGTDKAIKVSNGKIEVWIPRSQISDECEDKGKLISIFIPEWLAHDKGLI